MTSSATTAKPLFNRSLAGQRSDVQTVLVERGQIRFLSTVLGELHPIHHDVEAARATGYPDLVAPLSFPMVVDQTADHQRISRGQPSVLQWLGCDFTRVLHGEESYTYHSLIFAGDELAHHVEVEGFEEKKGGLLEFAHMRMVLTHPQRGVVVTARRVAVHRLG